MPRKKAYLNNRDLLAQTVESKNQNKMTNELAKMLILLVKRYSERSNFSGYTYIDDMRGYAITELMRSWTNFKPEVSSNAFAFFTQCVKNSFVQYLNKEKRQRDIRDAVLVDKGLTPSFTYQEDQAKKARTIDDEENWSQQQKQKENLLINDEEERPKSEFLTF